MQLMQDIVLCKIYRKATSLKVLEQRAAMEEEMKTIFTSPSPPSPPLDTVSFCGQPEEFITPMSVPHVMLKQEEQEVLMVEEITEEKAQQKKGCTTTLQMPLGNANLPELQVPKTDWSQDPFWSQLSPWLQNLTQNLTPYAGILN